jgi:hypothetical protein
MRCIPRRSTSKLGRQDSNLRVAAPKAAALPLGYAPITGLVKSLRRSNISIRIFEFPAKRDALPLGHAPTGHSKKRYAPNRKRSGIKYTSPSSQNQRQNGDQISIRVFCIDCRFQCASRTASASISISIAGWINDFTSIMLVAGGFFPKNSRWAFPYSDHLEMSVTNILVLTTPLRSAPSACSALSISTRQRAACA